MCRRECPVCQAVTDQTDGKLCRHCQGRCRTCSTRLPQRPAPTPTRVEATHRKDKRDRWARIYYPLTGDQDLCDACQRATVSTDPLRAVLAALPDKLLHACGGGVPATVVQTIQTELLRTTAARIAARIERRWWGTWAVRPLKREAEPGQDGYGPDDVAVWLLAPTPCDGRCEDGWRPATRPTEDDQPCPVCRGGWLLPDRRLEPDTRDDRDHYESEQPAYTAANRTPAQAVAHRPPHRECEGRGGTCGRPVGDPYNQCPACLDWPLCACGTRRYDPDRGTVCASCQP
ncbi:hypothetical protein [Streptomyces cucumeris]|uniref:hypothetical protein n=1 Tax=Streptomyces cucumeris TaxID=2962890 RepID=UPI0020C8BB1D|nr:hypothetical protein [Streptomyces sp. NEAU-Y11]MCP9213286.1 hypothetical protein [Streptomyces sp. NEAU-Y11]